MGIGRSKGCVYRGQVKLSPGTGCRVLMLQQAVLVEVLLQAQVPFVDFINHDPDSKAYVAGVTEPFFARPGLR